MINQMNEYFNGTKSMLDQKFLVEVLKPINALYCCLYTITWLCIILCDDLF